MQRLMILIVALGSLTACHQQPSEIPNQNMSGRPGLSVNEEATSREQANATNDTALDSPRPNTLEPDDLTNSTTDVGGSAAIDNARPR